MPKFADTLEEILGKKLLIHTFFERRLENQPSFSMKEFSIFCRFGLRFEGSESAPSFFRLVFLHLLSRICYTQITFNQAFMTTTFFSCAIPSRAAVQPDPGLSAEGSSAGPPQKSFKMTLSHRLARLVSMLRALQTAQLLGHPSGQDTPAPRAPHRRRPSGRFVLETPIRRPGLQKSGRRVLP